MTRIMQIDKYENIQSSCHNTGVIAPLPEERKLYFQRANKAMLVLASTVALPM